MLDLLHYTDSYAQALANRQQAKRDLEFSTMEREEESRMLALLPVEKHAEYLAERQRIRERREDIKREERQHRERLAVESRKAAALREIADAQRDRTYRDLFFR